MINLKIGDKRVGLPNKWNELKLRDYEKIYTIIKNGLTDEELTDIEETETDVEKISHKQMERALDIGSLLSTRDRARIASTQSAW